MKTLHVVESLSYNKLQKHPPAFWLCAGPRISKQNLAWELMAEHKGSVGMSLECSLRNVSRGQC